MYLYHPQERPTGMLGMMPNLPMSAFSCYVQWDSGNVFCTAPGGVTVNVGKLAFWGAGQPSGPYKKWGSELMRQRAWDRYRSFYEKRGGHLKPGLDGAPDWATPPSGVG